MTRVKTLCKFLDPDRKLSADTDWEYVEIPVEPDMLARTIDSQQQDYMYDEKQEWGPEYTEALYRAIDQLTEKQKCIVEMWLDGRSQQEIAEHMGITQGAISLAWHGSKNRSTQGVHLKRYGGILKSLQRKISNELEQLKQSTSSPASNTSKT